MGTRKNLFQPSAADSGAQHNNRLRLPPSISALFLQSCFVPPSPILQVKGRGWGEVTCQKNVG